MSYSDVNFENERSRQNLESAIAKRDQGYLLDWIYEYTTDSNVQEAIDLFIDETNGVI